MTEQDKTVVRPNTEKYTKTKTATGNATLHNGDVVASTLASLLLSETFAVAAKMIDGVDIDTLKTKYGHLNVGMQRMNLGNRIRGTIAKIDKGNAKEIEKIEKANAKLVEKAKKSHDDAVAAIEKANAVEGAEQQELPVYVQPELAAVPELVEGKGEEAFLAAVEEFNPAINKRAEEAEAAAQAKAEAAAKAKVEKDEKAAAKAAKAAESDDEDEAEAE